MQSKQSNSAIVVEYFDIEYKNKKDTIYLIYLLKEHHEAVFEDWDGTLFFSISLNWYYKHQNVNLSMLGYKKKSCTIFNIKANKTSESTTQTYKTNPCVQNIIFQKSDDGPKLK